MHNSVRAQKWQIQRKEERMNDLDVGIVKRLNTYTIYNVVY